jgi:polygalacturonase
VCCAACVSHVCLSQGLHIKTADTRRGQITNILFQNNTIYNNTAAIVLEHDYQQEHDKASEIHPTLIQNISFQGNRGRGTATGIQFRCSEKVPCQNVTFLNNSFHHASISCENVHVIDENGNDICPSVRRGPRISKIVELKQS